MKTKPTEALEEIKRRTWIAEDFDISDGFGSHEVVDEDDAINIANIAFREGQSSPKIKQLEWDGKEELAFFTAKTNIGEYMIDSPHHDGIFMLMYTPDWSYESFLLHTSNSTDELKSFAQRDFEQRIKECLITE